MTDLPAEEEQDEEEEKQQGSDCEHGPGGGQEFLVPLGMRLSERAEIVQRANIAFRKS